MKVMSDPGTSGLLSPYSKIKGLYFNDQNEPDDFIVQFREDLKDMLKEEGVQYIDIEFENKDDYFTALSNLEDFVLDNIKVQGTSKNKYIITIEEDTINDDVSTPEPIIE